MAGQSNKHKNSVKKYYQDTRAEYRLLWRIRKNLGLHFGYYDESHDNHNDAVINLNKKLAQLADIQKKDVVLDAGCGVGGTSLWLAGNIGCSVTGINIVPHQIEKAKQYAKERKLTSLTSFKIADYSNTKMSDESFTVFLGIESIVHAEDKQEVFKEAYRLLKPGGKVVVCEYMLKNEPLTSEEDGLIGSWLDGWSMPSILAEDQYRDISMAAGFKLAEFHNWTDRVKPSLNRLNRYAKAFRVAAPALKKLKIAKNEQFKNLSATEAQMESLNKGLWQYKVMVATK